MGLFDSVWIACPHCGENNEFQSKGAIFPYLDSYKLENAPIEVLMDIDSGDFLCSQCKGAYRVQINVDLAVSVLKDGNPIESISRNWKTGDGEFHEKPPYLNKDTSNA